MKLNNNGSYFKVYSRGSVFVQKPPADILFIKSIFAIAAFRTYAVFVQSDTAQRATVDLVFRFEFARGGIYTAGKRYFGNIEFIFQQVVHDFNHSLNRHRFFRNHQTTIGICSCKSFLLYEILKIFQN